MCVRDLGICTCVFVCCVCDAVLDVPVAAYDNVLGVWQRWS